MQSAVKSYSIAGNVLGENFHGLLTVAAKRCYALKFHEENFHNSHKISKKFSLLKVSCYMVLRSFEVTKKLSGCRGVCYDKHW